MATVITNMVSAIPYVGTDLVQWVWGGFAVDNATLNRFFSLHYLLPFILAALVVVHLLALHTDGSNNPLGISSNGDKIAFHPYFTIKDLLGFILFFIFFSFFVFFAPNVLGPRMAPIDWKIYGEMNYMRDNIVNRTRYWKYCPTIICFSRAKYWTFQVKNRFLDINSQATLTGIPYLIGESMINMADNVPNSIASQLIDQRNNQHGGASETTRSNLKLNVLPPFYAENRIKSNQYKLCNFGSQNFNQWLAGLIDADGYIYYNSRINVITIEITMATRDILALNTIKERLGGSIKKRTGSESYRWRISSRKNVIKILQSINGDLKNPVRLDQFYQVCKVLNLPPRTIRNVSWNSAWLTGFFDGDGTIILLRRPKNSIGCRGIQISFGQKDPFILESIQNLIGGSLVFDKSSPGWKLAISSQSQILNLHSYFQRFPSLTSKNNRLLLIPEIYNLQYSKKAFPEDWDLLYNKFYQSRINFNHD